MADEPKYDPETQKQLDAIKTRADIANLTKRADDTNLIISGALTSILKLQNQVIELQQKQRELTEPKVKLPTIRVSPPSSTASLLDRFRNLFRK